MNKNDGDELKILWNPRERNDVDVRGHNYAYLHKIR